MSTELLNSFDILNINEKRNQISNELITIHELIKQIETKHGITPITSIKNYDIEKDKDLSEAEILTFLYEDIYNVEQELISLINIEENLK